MAPDFIKIAIIATIVAIITIGVIVGVIIAVVPSSSDNECLNIQPPSNIKIDLEENHIVIQWSPSKSDCDLSYNLTVKMDGDVDPINYQTTQTFLTISKTPNYCSMIDVTLIAVGEESKSDDVTTSYFAEPINIPIVKNPLMEFQSIEKKVKISWELQDGLDRCSDIKYKVELKGKNGILDSIDDLVKKEWVSKTLSDYDNCGDILATIIPRFDLKLGIPSDVQCSDVEGSGEAFGIIDEVEMEKWDFEEPEYSNCGSVEGEVPKFGSKPGTLKNAKSCVED